MRSRRREAKRTATGVKADDGVRTRDPQLGKLMLYQLSYVRARRILPRRLLSVGNDHGRPNVHVVEQPLGVRNVHANAAM
jgi:hypothetical protein